jgi:hypothetical protein
VNIKVILRSDPAIYKEFEIYIKQEPDPELKTLDEILHGQSSTGSKKKKS